MKTPWFYGYRKLLKIQKAIHQFNEKKNIRFCRNYQRLLHRNSFIQLLIINEILKDNLNFSEIKFGSKKYRQFFKRDIVVRLWIFALSPILDNKKSLTYFKSKEIYEIFCLYLKKPFVQYILFCKFSNFFSKKNKYWIISNISIEKKFFLNEAFKKNKFSKKLFSLKRIFKQLIILNFKVNLKNYKQFTISKSFYSAKKIFNDNFLSNPLEIFEYNTIVLFFLKKEFQGIYLDPKIYGLNFKFRKFCFLKNGMYFLGWFFRKNANYLNVRVSKKNFYSYKKEINKYLNKNQPIDKILSNFNRKILNWKKCYNTKKIKIYRNDYFFWQIWYWIKKRHKKKDIKWLYNYYWKKSTSKKWILSVNEKICIFSKKIK